MGDPRAARDAIAGMSVQALEELLEARVGLFCVAWQRARLIELVAERRGASLYESKKEEMPRLSGDELQYLIEQLSVGETYFFREPDQFTVLTDVALPDRLGQVGARRPLRILSAGCSSGEEAYSIAIALHHHRHHHHHHHHHHQGALASEEVAVHGIVVSATAVRRARSARYSAWALRATSEELRERYFQRDGDEFQPSEKVRSMVKFEERNLLDPDPYFSYPTAFDVIFCRNVLIYFSDRSLRLAVARLTDALLPGGYLFLGHSETLRGLTDAFEIHQRHDAFFYRKKPGPTAAPPPEQSSWQPSFFGDISRSAERVARLATAVTPQNAASPAQSPRPSTFDASWAPFEEVLKLLYAEQFEKALELLAKVPYDVGPQPTRTLIAAAVSASLGRLIPAQRSCQELLDAGAYVAEAYYVLGLCSEHGGDRDLALRYYQQATRAAPHFAMASLRLGILLRRGLEHEAARRALRQALALLGHERKERILLFGGGFQREALLSLCRAELKALGVMI